jgi:hypothetical protein
MKTHFSFLRVNVSMINLNTAEGRQVYSQEIEKNSIIALRAFLSLALEVLNMWKILCDHQFHIVLHVRSHLFLNGLIVKAYIF